MFNYIGIDDSLAAGHFVDESAYEAKGSHKMPNSNAPLKGRLNANFEVYIYILINLLFQ